MKRGEQSRVEIEKTFIAREDEKLYQMLIATGNYNENQAVMAHITLHRLTKVEDWFKDETTIVKTIRSGKGRTPFVDSLIKLRLQVLVNGEEILSNYPKETDFKNLHD
jgi:hypothetical protein